MINNVYKVATAEIYYIELDDVTYEIQVRTTQGSKSVIFDEDLTTIIPDSIQSSINRSVTLGVPLEDALKTHPIGN